jgi:hypothetical protein
MLDLAGKKRNEVELSSRVIMERDMLSAALRTAKI